MRNESGGGSLLSHSHITMQFIYMQSLHLLKKSGANRKQANADREEFTDRRASYDRKKEKYLLQSVHQQEETRLHTWEKEVLM